jgi:hypothetical protein
MRATASKVRILSPSAVHQQYRKDDHEQQSAMVSDGIAIITLDERERTSSSRINLCADIKLNEKIK